ncbi:MAG: hypothetical protein ACK5NT_01440 [Pyrinomonadaceae bacterium]
MINGFKGSISQSYVYDSLNRIQTATENYAGGQSWKETFSYDRFGNRRFDAANTTTITGCPANVCNPTIKCTTNFSLSRLMQHSFVVELTQIDGKRPN